MLTSPPPFGAAVESALLTIVKRLAPTAAVFELVILINDLAVASAEFD